VSAGAVGPQWPRWFGRGWLVVGNVFLFLPIASLIAYSFNDSPVPNLWRGFTWRWYAGIGADTALLSGLWISLRVALATATASVVLGALAAWALVKVGRFRGRAFFSGLVHAPLVMPEVVVGLSLLLTLVSVQRAVGVPERGLLTIWLGHLLVGMAYATVVIQARLRDLDPRLEEAAMDLGATPWQVFRLVTLPLIGSSLAAAWLLTFTLSLDDVVLASFLSGPGASTMPQVVFSRARMGLNPGVNAMATLIVLAVGLGVALFGYLIAQSERERLRRRPVSNLPDTASPTP
jgi:putrescine transport system permease protein